MGTQPRVLLAKGLSFRLIPTSTCFYNSFAHNLFPVALWPILSATTENLCHHWAPLRWHIALHPFQMRMIMHKGRQNTGDLQARAICLWTHTHTKHNGGRGYSGLGMPPHTQPSLFPLTFSAPLWASDKLGLKWGLETENPMRVPGCAPREKTLPGV